LRANLAKRPSGGDRDVAKDIAAGVCDIGLGNQYYIGLMTNGSPEQKKWAEAVRVILPTFKDGGTHINVSGALVTKHAPNRDNAVKLIEYMTSNEAQRVFADVNFEYPVRPGIAVNPLVQSFGELKPDPMSVADIAAGARPGERARRQGRLRPLRAPAAPARPVSGARAAAVPPRRMFGSAPRWSILVLFGAAALVGAPLALARRDALAGDLSLWKALAASVLPAALIETGLLIAGVAVLCGTIGVGTAWLVTAHRFPGRDALAWLLPLPLAVPTYITAYVYVEIFDAAGPVRSLLRQLAGAQATATRGSRRSARCRAACS
jgi:ABC-type sugar transport system permease subunit